jgi:hypothetical protein
MIKCFFEQSDLLIEEKFDKIKAKSLLERVFDGKSEVLDRVDQILNRCEEKGE